VLGRGGMATVYLADDRKHRRQVAIKVLRPDLAASLGAARSPGIGTRPTQGATGGRASHFGRSGDSARRAARAS
jgi:serine/threonine protein kinase